MSSLKRKVFIAIEWPRNCRYWKLRKVAQFMNSMQLIAFNFHGCMVGIRNKDEIPIKKPWTIATNLLPLGRELYPSFSVTIHMNTSKEEARILRQPKGTRSS